VSNKREDVAFKYWAFTQQKEVPYPKSKCKGKNYNDDGVVSLYNYNEEKKR
jgi:hypothetical protein